MENKKRYIPLIFFIPLIIRAIINPPPLNIKTIGFSVIVLLIILLFVYLERSMNRRALHFDQIKDKQFLYILKFSFLYGAPVSLLLSWLISDKVKVIYVVLFVIVPTVVMFGWAGFMDWKECQKRYLGLKYSSHAGNAA
jgi:hypothetical protein